MQVQSCCFVNLLQLLLVFPLLFVVVNCLSSHQTSPRLRTYQPFMLGLLYNYVLLTALIELFHVTTYFSHHLVSQDLRKNLPLDRICHELDFRRLLLTLQPISHLSAFAGSHTSTTRQPCISYEPIVSILANSSHRSNPIQILFSLYQNKETLTFAFLLNSSVILTSEKVLFIFIQWSLVKLGASQTFKRILILACNCAGVAPYYGDTRVSRASGNTWK